MENRHKRIIAILEQDKQVTVQHLSKVLNTSAVTIRKDLKLLERNRLLFKTHGGASIESPYVNDQPVNEKEFINAQEKSAIGREAVKMLDNDQYIIIASGTTALEFARHINPLKKLTVVTSALNVALELLRKPTIELLMLGGYVSPSSHSVIGQYPTKILEEIACSKLFLGVDGIDLDYGLSTTNALTAHLNKQMIKSARRVIVLTDSTKFGKRSFGRICGIDQVDHIITDKNVAPDIVKKIKSMGIGITVAE
ncbi:MAG: DeoR/GlpR family DNA-binding transcription regulator [Bacteroidota bacterium]